VTDLFDPSTFPEFAPEQGERRRSSAEYRAQAKRRRRRQWIVVTVLLVLVAGVGVTGWKVWTSLTTAPPAEAEEVVITDYPGPGVDPVRVVIREGDSGTAIGQTLVDNKVVASLEAFLEALALNPGSAGIQPGTYELFTQMSAAEAVATLVKGEKVQIQVTIPEGFTVVNIVDRISSVTDISVDDLNAALADPASIGLPEQAGGIVEGWLFPATYPVQPTDTAVSVLSQMVAQTVFVLTDEGIAPEDWQKTIIIASLIEREAKHDEDRPKMARAILNRLDRGLMLEIDASVAYGLNKSGLDLTLADLADASNPFNTYAHAGLPPAPIANPGRPSIAAAANPEDGPWIFWITVNLETGETRFTDDPQQHLAWRHELDAWLAENGTPRATPTP
jgi:UPF0755 protein